MNVRENKGITLIALVITIILLLILAGVSIATLSGENGLLSKSTKAKQETIKAEMKEQLELALQDLQIERRTQGQIPTLIDISQKWLDEKLGKEYPTVHKFNTTIPNVIYVRMIKDGIIGDFEIDEKLNIQHTVFSNISINVEPVFGEGTVSLKVTARNEAGGLKTIQLIDENNEVLFTTDGENQEEKEVTYPIEFGKKYKVKVLTTDKETKEKADIKIDERWYKVIIADEFYQQININNTKVDVKWYEPYEVEITGKTGHTLTSLSINGNPVNVSDGKGKISIANVTEDIEITGTIERMAISVTNKLDSKLTTDNSNNSVLYDDPYHATISATAGYYIKSLTVTMNGTDISATAITGEGKININNVTGKLVITGTSEKIKKEAVVAITGHDSNSVRIAVEGFEQYKGATYDYYVKNTRKVSGSKKSTIGIHNLGLTAGETYPVKVIVHYGNNLTKEFTRYAKASFYPVLTDKGVCNYLSGDDWIYQSSTDYTCEYGLSIYAYDGDHNTYSGYYNNAMAPIKSDVNLKRYVLIDPSAYGKKISIHAQSGSSFIWCNIKTISTENVWDNSTWKFTNEKTSQKATWNTTFEWTINEGDSGIEFSTTGGYASHFVVREITMLN